MNNPNKHGLPEERVYTLEDAVRVTNAFLRILAENGIVPVPGGSLERMTYNVYDALYRHEGDEFRVEEDIREVLSDVSAMADLALQVVRVRNHPSFATLIPHFPLLNKGEAAQNRKVSPTDQAANKIFELYTACLVMRCGTDVDLEAPDRGKGGHPDVLGTIRGKRWGFACKVVHSVNPESLLQNIQKAVDQIEGSEAERGVVVINFKNVIEQNKYWRVLNEEEWRAGAEPIFSASLSAEQTQSELQRDLAAIVDSIKAYVTSDVIRDVFKGKKASTGIYVFIHIVVGFMAPDGSAIPMVQKWPTWLQVGPVDEQTHEVLMCLHEHIHDVPKGTV